MSHISDTITNCHVLLEKYRWMAGDLGRPQVSLGRETERKRTVAKPVSQEEHELIVRLYKQNIPYADIIAQTGRSYAVIRRALLRAGVKVKTLHTHLRDDDLEQIESLWKGGMKPSHISLKLNIPLPTVKARLVRAGLKHLSTR